MLKTTQWKYYIYLYAFTPVYLLNNEYEKGQYLHWLVKSAQVKVLCLLVYILNLIHLLKEMRKWEWEWEWEWKWQWQWQWEWECKWEWEWERECKWEWEWEWECKWEWEWEWEWECKWEWEWECKWEWEWEWSMFTLVR